MSCLFTNKPYHTVSVKLGEVDDKSILNCRVGISSIDADAPVRGVGDSFDVGGSGPTHMSPEDAVLERMAKEEEAERQREEAELFVAESEGKAGGA